MYDLLCRHFHITNKGEKTAIMHTQNSSDARKLIAIDFDGVLHSCINNSYKGEALKIDNPPVPDSIKWLTALVNDSRFFVTIYSCRSKVLGFEKALHEWLLKNGMEQKDINKISVSVTKPDAFLFIDDRNWKFNGKFPRIDDLLTFKSWSEK
jgi:hypothetical protein